MKKTLLLITAIFVFIGIQDANATYVHIEKHNGGLFGYKDVDYTQNGADKWLYCNDPGWSRCRATRPGPGEGGEFDDVDVLYIYDQIDYVEEQIEKNILKGERVIRIHVEGEECDRVYRVTWDYSDAQNGNTHSERLPDIC